MKIAKRWGLAFVSTPEERNEKTGVQAIYGRDSFRIGLSQAD